MFRRRNRLTLTRRIRDLIWPQGGWRRALRYLLFRLYRLRGSPRQVALGFACGAFVSFTPLFGLHYATSVLAAWLLRSNVLAAFIGANLGFLYPLVLLWAYHLGTSWLGIRPLGFSSGQASAILLQDFWNLFLPVLVGSIPVGLCVGAVSFTIVFWAVAACRRLRGQRPELPSRSASNVAIEDTAS